MTRRISKDNVNSPGKVVKTLKTMQVEIEALIAHTNTIATVLTGNYIVSKPTLTTGAVATGIGWSAFDIAYGGTVYKIAAGSGAMAAKTFTSGTFAAFAIHAGIDGTVDIISAVGNSGGYATSGLALAGLSGVAANHVRAATMTLSRSSGPFVIGTDELASGTPVYTDADAMLTLLTSTSLTAVSDTVITPN